MSSRWLRHIAQAFRAQELRPERRILRQSRASLTLTALIVGAAPPTFAQYQERSQPVQVAPSLSASSTAQGAAVNAAIRIVGASYLGDLPTFVAAKEQLFNHHELTATFSFSASDRRHLDKLRAGEVDFALMTPAALIIDYLGDPDPGGGDDPVILASLLHSTSFNQVVFRTNQGIDAPADLRGRRVALPHGTNAEFLWWIFVTVHGLDPGSVSVEHHPIADIPALVLGGSVDAAVIWEPEGARLRARLDGALGHFPIRHNYTARWVLVTLRNTATAGGDICDALLAAYDDAIDRIERDGEPLLRGYAEHFRVPLHSLHQHWSRFDYDLSIDWSLIAALQEQLRWAQQRRQPPIRPGTPPASVLSLIAAEPLRRRSPGAVGIPNARATDSRLP